METIKFMYCICRLASDSGPFSCLAQILFRRSITAALSNMAVLITAGAPTAVTGIKRLHLLAQWSLYVPPGFDTQNFYVLPTQCIDVFYMNLSTNSDYFPTQH